MEIFLSNSYIKLYYFELRIVNSSTSLDLTSILLRKLIDEGSDIKYFMDEHMLMVST